MGSSKKSKDKDRSREHKKKSKKRSHSRSRSPREKKHKRRDRDRSREKGRGDRPEKRRDEYEGYEEPAAYRSSADVQIPGLGDPYAAYEDPSRGAYGGYEEGEIPGLGFDVKEEKPSVQELGEGQGSQSLSITETNAIRAKLGMKPLEMPGEGGSSSKKEDVHVPAVNMAQVKKQDEMKDKLKAAKEKRRINTLLGKVKTLGESDDDDDVSGWVLKMRKSEKEKKMADKRAKLMDEMDNEFGISDLLEEEFGVKDKKTYTSKDLTGLKVHHSGSAFKEGKTVILTLEDRGVLEEGEETLVNVNMVDNERYAENIENKKKKPDYKAYDDEFDEYGMPKKKDVLDKYNEEIDGKKKDGFVLKGGGKYAGTKERMREEMKSEMEKHRIELSLPAPTVSSEFYTEEEMLSFNKVKKKVRKIRKKPKMLKADDLLPLQDDVMDVPGIPGLDFVGGGPVKPDPDDEPDMDGPDEDLTGVVVDDEAANELQMALEKTRKLRHTKHMESADKRVADDIVQKVKQEPEDSDSDADTHLLEKSNIVLNQTSEFCRTLGEIPTYGQSGNRLEEEEDKMDFEEEKPQEDMEDANNPGWQEVPIEEEHHAVDVKKEEKAVLDDEPIVGLGMAAALSLATKKGYLSESANAVATKKTNKIENQNYSIEDKSYHDMDDKYRKRERFSGNAGMVQEFKDKEGYKPNVKLDYVDESGRSMGQKEAFRHLSHCFHGKGSGKMKTEKRKKKIEEEQLMKSMSSTDTPLGTVAMLEDKLLRQKTPYLVLSGGNKTLTTDRIAK